MRLPGRPQPAAFSTGRRTPLLRTSSTIYVRLLERNLARDAPFTWAVILGLMKTNSIVAVATDDIPLVRNVIAEHAQRPFAGTRLPTDRGITDVIRPLVEVD